MAFSLITGMIERTGYPLLGEADLDGFSDTRNEVVLFFTENPERFPESNDVAMVLPELIKAFEGRLQAGVVNQDFQHQLQRRYGFGAWPALVLLRKGAYLGVITGMRNWDDYLHLVRDLLNSEPVAIPGFKVPVVTAPADSQEKEHD
ncbi:MAG: hydrogenase [Gammaproteobacteria bacterium]|nr:hydrogenase [Gammaproteobacteria bacterium]